VVPLLANGASEAWFGYRDQGVVLSQRLRAEGSDLPIQEPVKFDFVVNLKTARELGLTIPPLILGRADEVIE
jgi:putative ABC transport system substrate-binding protein